jgi:hypothetical protein
MEKESQKSSGRKRRNLEIIVGLTVAVAAGMPLIRLIGAAMVVDGIIRA